MPAQTLTVLAALTLAFLPGCGRSRVCVPPALAEREWTDLTCPGAYQEIGPSVSERLSLALRPRDGIPSDRRRPVQALALSGGGKFGAFGVGVLNGWTETGSRPYFDVVTGISTGALAATYAFLGPRYDRALEKLFTNIATEDIYDRRRLIAILFSVSVASNQPLRNLIEENITPATLREVACEHAKGRRLFIGTANVDASQLVIWDMGALASKGELTLFREVILASAAVPGFFPPVEIEVELDGERYGELHIDGGTVASIFLEPYMLVRAPPDPRDLPSAPPGSKVWALVNGKLFSDRRCVRAGPLGISAQAATTLISAKGRNDLARIHTMSLAVGAGFKLIALPQEYQSETGSLEFDPAEMRRLFDAGYRLGLQGEAAWGETPPPLLGERNLPRTGTRFAIGGAE